jgi:hypothetical protein
MDPLPDPVQLLEVNWDAEIRIIGGKLGDVLTLRLHVAPSAAAIVIV